MNEVKIEKNENTSGLVFDAWFDRFFDRYYRGRPVNATFIGVHDYDHELPDLSAHGVADAVTEMQALLDAAAALPIEGLTSVQATDKQLCEGFLRTQIWEYKSAHFYRGNPSLYVSEAVFGVLSLFLSEFDTLENRVDSAMERLSATPTLLKQGMENIEEAPTSWIKTAIRECEGARKFLSGGALTVAGRAATERYARRVEQALTAVDEFQHHLVTGLRHSAADHCAAGEEALNLHLREAHFLGEDAEEIVRYAEEQLSETSAYLTQHAEDFGASGPDEVLGKLQDIYPSPEHYYARYQEVWDRVQQIAVEQELVTWPDFPIEYAPRPDWVREAAPHLYFLFYRSPAAFNRPAIHKYLVTPIDTDMPADTQRSLLRANNDSVIKLNHVVHHGGIGHHIQNWHAFRAKSRVGQIAAVDCASRIAMNCGGSMAEGWACYATDLIGEAGGLTDLERYAEKQSRRRMSARAIVDIRLHQGRFTFDEAVDFYQQNAGMNEAAAISEVTKNGMNPGGAVMYLTGCDAIHTLRAKMQSLRGNRFNLRTFHDEFLSYGSIPVALIAKAMLREQTAELNERAQ